MNKVSQWQSSLIFLAYFTALIVTNREVAPSSIDEIHSKILMNLTIEKSLNHFVGFFDNMASTNRGSAP